HAFGWAFHKPVNTPVPLFLGRAGIDQLIDLACDQVFCSAPFVRDGRARPPQGDGGTDIEASSTRLRGRRTTIAESDVRPACGPSTCRRDPLSRASPSGTRSRSADAPLARPA